jgi:hypothetical protein
MNVAQLRAVLDHLPDDFEVHICSGLGVCTHVDRVERKLAGAYAPMREWVAIHGTRVLAAALVLRGRTGWWDPPPTFELRGPFRRAAELEHRLDDLAAR